MNTSGRIRIIVLVALLVLALPLLAACGGDDDETQTVPPGLGEVNGKLLQEDTLLPLKGALVVLAQYRNEHDQWLLSTNLATTTNNDGSFVLSGVEAGSYLVLYNSTGNAHEATKSWDRAELFFGDDNVLYCADTTSKLEFDWAPVRAGVTYPGKGHLILQEWDFVLEYVAIPYEQGSPVKVEIEPNQIAEIEILATYEPLQYPWKSIIVREGRPPQGIVLQGKALQVIVDLGRELSISELESLEERVRLVDENGQEYEPFGRSSDKGMSLSVSKDGNVICSIEADFAYGFIFEVGSEPSNYELLWLDYPPFTLGNPFDNLLCEVQ